MERKEINKEKRLFSKKKTILAIFLSSLLFTIGFVLSLPGEPGIDSVSNSTWTNSNSGFFNISGGYIATINLTANFQNTRWKAFIGNVTGKFTLSDSGGSTIFDWTLSTTTGRVYATRDTGTIEWSSIACSSVANLESENSILAHTSLTDNLTSTFDDTTHSAFIAAGQFIGANTCRSLNTYINNVTQNTDFEEMVLYDGTSLIYATVLENDVIGYNGAPYDFQMLVPENGSASWTGAIAYYLYVELD